MVIRFFVTSYGKIALSNNSEFRACGVLIRYKKIIANTITFDFYFSFNTEMIFEFLNRVFYESIFYFDF